MLEGENVWMVMAADTELKSLVMSWYLSTRTQSVSPWNECMLHAPIIYTAGCPDPLQLEDGDGGKVDCVASPEGKSLCSSLCQCTSEGSNPLHYRTTSPICPPSFSVLYHGQASTLFFFFFYSLPPHIYSWLGPASCTPETNAFATQTQLLWSTVRHLGFFFVHGSLYQKGE